MTCGNWCTIQKQLSEFTSKSQVVWAVFDCNRDKVVPPKPLRVRNQGGSAAGGDEEWSDSEEDKEQVSEKYGTIFTYAAKMGQPKTELVDSTFSDTFARHMSDFLKQNKGSFSLVESLLKIPSSVAKTEFNGIKKDIKIFGCIPSEKVFFTCY